jgi:hypothetical protein
MLTLVLWAAGAQEIRYMNMSQHRITTATVQAMLCTVTEELKIL